MEIELPSKAKLHINMAPFAEAKELYQACLEEVKNLKLDAKAEVDVNFYKDIFCAAFSSKRIDAALWACTKRCLYNKAAIKDDTFEPVEAREDYMEVCFKVLEANLKPFTKALSQQLQLVIEKTSSFLA